MSVYRKLAYPEKRCHTFGVSVEKAECGALAVEKTEWLPIELI